MKKILLIVLCVFVTFTLIGCVSARKVTRERVDQQVSGNTGYIQGSGSTISRPTSTTREYIQVDVEVPTPEEMRANMPKPKPRTQDKLTEGNRGYIGGEGTTRSSATSTATYEPQASQERWETEQTYEETAPATTYAPTTTKKEITYDTYTVKTGDSLSRIAGKPEIYGKMSKWRRIYEANKDKISDPNKLKPGLVLRIPREEEINQENKYIK